MKKSFAIIGLGRFGLGLIEELSKLNSDVIAIDCSVEAVKAASKFVNSAIICDSTNEKNLQEIGIKNVDHVVVAIGGNILATITTTIILHEFGIKKITVRVDDEHYTQTIKRIGATEVIIPEKSASVLLANRIVSDAFLDYYQAGDEYSIVRLAVNANFTPKTLEELNARNSYDINILLIVRNNIYINPRGTDEIKPSDEILVMGKTSKILKFDRFINS